MGINTYRDWIPEGDNLGAQGQIHQDFVVDKTVKKDEKSETCDICQKKFRSKSTLLVHKTSHLKKL